MGILEHQVHRAEIGAVGGQQNRLPGDRHGVLDTRRVAGDLPVERIADMIGRLLYGTMFTNRIAGLAVSLNKQRAALHKIVYRWLLSESERGPFRLPGGDSIR